MFWNEVDEALVLPAQGYKLEALAGTCLADASVRDGAQFEGELQRSNFSGFATTGAMGGEHQEVLQVREGPLGRRARAVLRFLHHHPSEGESKDGDGVAGVAVVWWREWIGLY